MKDFFYKAFAFALLTLLVHLPGASPASASGTPAINDSACVADFSGLIENGGLALQKNGEPVCSHNPDQQLIPASIIKIATALFALQELGTGFRFETRFYHDRNKDLYIQGFGDPFLVSEELALVIGRLRSQGIKAVNNIFIDDSAFDLKDIADGSGGSDNPFDATNSALAVNFNTINFIVTADGSVQSAEAQTPTLPLMQVFGKDLAPGTYRINIARRAEDRGNTALYVGQLFRALLAGNDIAAQGEISRASVPVDLAPVYIHRSTRDMESIVRSLLLFSNNFIANQLFLACGAEKSGYPADWQKSRSAFKEFASISLGLDEQAISLFEGSGLSRRNLVTARSMLSILEAFKPYADFLPVNKGRLVKSGTLKNVYSYAGYFRSGRVLDSFAIILNQQDNHRNRLLDILEQAYRGKH